MVLEECGFCEGSGSVQFEVQRKRYPPNTYGAVLGHNKVKNAPKYVEPQVGKCPICEGGKLVDVPAFSDGLPVPCPECEGTGRPPTRREFGIPRRCRTCDGSGWTGYRTPK